MIHSTGSWRFVDVEVHDAFMNMAIDEAVSESVARGESPPTIRFYRWQPSAVSIGYFQSLQREVAVDICRQQGIDVVRRRTGGGAVYHDFESELTYSIIGKEELFPKDLSECYRLICGWIVDALKSLGLSDAAFHPINDVLAGGKKVSGNAQTRRGGVLLQHGTILYGVDVRKMFSLLKVGQEKIADKMIASVEERVTSLKHLNPAITFGDTCRAMQDAMLAGKEWESGSWSAQELERAKQLAEERYATPEWNGMR